MSEPYLILHRVRGQPAFDIAERMCSDEPPCQPNCSGWNGETCNLVDVWIIPTSGHRAYPLNWWAVEDLRDEDGSCMIFKLTSNYKGFDSWPDHYSANDRLHVNYNTEPKTVMIPTLYEPDPSALSLAQRLGLVPKIPPITRRL